MDEKNFYYRDLLNSYVHFVSIRLHDLKSTVFYLIHALGKKLLTNGHLNFLGKLWLVQDSVSIDCHYMAFVCLLDDCFSCLTLTVLLFYRTFFLLPLVQRHCYEISNCDDPCRPLLQLLLVTKNSTMWF